MTFCCSPYSVMQPSHVSPSHFTCTHRNAICLLSSKNSSNLACQICPSGFFSFVAYFILNLHSFDVFNRIFVGREREPLSSNHCFETGLFVFLAYFVLHIFELIITTFLIKKNKYGKGFHTVMPPQPLKFC